VTGPEQGNDARTGHPVIDAALAGLTGVDGLPASEWITAYEAVHRSLRETLATIDEG